MLFVAATRACFLVPLCTIDLALVEIFEGPEIQQHSGQSIFDINIVFLGTHEIPGCDSCVTYTTPRGSAFFNSVEAFRL